MSLKSNQYYAIFLLSGSIALLYLAFNIEVVFFNGIVGPHHWVISIAIIMICLCFALFFSKANFIGNFPKLNELYKHACFALVVYIYSRILLLAGFLISTFAMMIIIGVLFQSKIKVAIISSALMTIVIFVAFDVLLGISLPKGSIFR